MLFLMFINLYASRVILEALGVEDYGVYNIVGGFFIDGLQGGTGAAHEISLNHTGHPIVSKLRDCYLAAVHQGKQG